MDSINILQEQPLNELPGFYTGHPSTAFVDDVRNNIHSTDFLKLKQVKSVTLTIPASDGINPGIKTSSFNHNMKNIPFPFIYTAPATAKLPITGVSADINNIFFTGNNYTLAAVTVNVVIYVYEIIRKI